MHAINNKIIFIAPLDWGMGHSSRCISIIRGLKKQNTIIIGVTIKNIKIFDSYFPELKKVYVPSYSINYSKKTPLWLKLIFQLPKIYFKILEEKKQLRQLIKLYTIDLVISDNRFGLSNKKIESIFITHQLNIQAPFFSNLANIINRKYLHQFNQVWVPDYEKLDKRLSGKLSESPLINIPTLFIGPQTALIPSNFEEKIKIEYDYLILLSGEEPQRTLLEKILIKSFTKSNKKIVLVRGSNSKFEIINSSKITYFDFAFGNELQNLILKSDTIICRSGYSTLMDLYLLKKNKIILIPTPGQTEQIYLATYWQRNFGAKTYHQNKIPLFD